MKKIKLIKKRIVSLVVAFALAANTFLMQMYDASKSSAEEPQLSDFIVIDQFGYLPLSNKTAVIRNPKEGADKDLSFSPGDDYSVINANTGEAVFEGKLEHKFDNDESSGDEIWWFDFSAVIEDGVYYILDNLNGVRSFDFKVSSDVYNEVLKQAVRMLFYQRVGFEKDANFAGEDYADKASHTQDANARYFYDKDNADTERDLSGGWYDAGDYNKYTAWTSRYIEELLETYRQNPKVFTDDYNIPESGNGIPDIIDEVKWGMDHLLRLQNNSEYRPTVLPPEYPDDIDSYDGSMLSVVGLSHNDENGKQASPPSIASGMTLYGPPNSTATYAASRAFSIGAIVFKEWDNEYSEKLKTAALKAFKWAEENPNVIFDNNLSSNGSSGLAAGNQEISLSSDESTGDRLENRLYASTYLYELTGDKSYLKPFDDNYEKFPLKKWWQTMDFYRTSQHMLFFRYMEYDDADSAVVSNLKSWMIEAFNKKGDFGERVGKDGYRSFIKDYNWGSNRAKSQMGNTFYKWAELDMEPEKSALYKQVAEDYIHYIHGVNPFNTVYLTNMDSFGSSKSLQSIYHTWFGAGTDWSRAGDSKYGPAPGYLSGGANKSYTTESNFWGYTPTAEESALIAYINENVIGSPPAKCYMDINDSWPINSWEITEPSIGYQTEYIKLLSKFASEEGSDPQGCDNCNTCGCTECFPEDGKCNNCGCTECFPEDGKCNNCGCTECFPEDGRCNTCGCTECFPEDGKCNNCDICGGYKPIFKTGYVLGNDDIGISDALEILMYLAKMNSSIIYTEGEGSRPWNAALIVSTKSPKIGDALDILMYLSGMKSSRLYEMYGF